MFYPQVEFLDLPNEIKMIIQRKLFLDVRDTLEGMVFHDVVRKTLGYKLKWNTRYQYWGRKSFGVIEIPDGLVISNVWEIFHLD